MLLLKKRLARVVFMLFVLVLLQAWWWGWGWGWKLREALLVVSMEALLVVLVRAVMLLAELSI